MLLLLGKIRKVFSGENQKEKGNPSYEVSSNQEKDPAECLNYFGYLANREKNTPIPQECISCLKALKCIELNLL